MSGTVSGQRWTKANSPYNVTGDILAGNLAIEAGVQVLLQGDYTFEVAGVLTVSGTPSEPVIFTRRTGSWQGIFFNYSSPGSRLVYCVISNSINSGVRITNSIPAFKDCYFINNSSPSHGGGIHAAMPSGDLVIENCTFRNNRAAMSGGGLYANLNTGTARIVNCQVYGNIANPSIADGEYAGGGLYVVGRADLVSSIVESNISHSACSSIYNCDVTGRGGGAYFSGSASVLNSLLIGNEVRADSRSYCLYGGNAYAYGGAIYLGLGTLTLKNSVLAENSCAPVGCANFVHGAGLFVDGGRASVINATFAYHTNSDAIWAGPGTVGITNCIVYFNGDPELGGAVTVAYSDVQGGFAGTGNIDFSPIFQSRSNLVAVTGSRTIDAGHTNAIYNDVCFPPSLGRTRNDMGAFGGPGTCPVLSSQLEQSFQLKVLAAVPNATYALQAATELAPHPTAWATVTNFSVGRFGDSFSYLEKSETDSQRFYRVVISPTEEALKKR